MFCRAQFIWGLCGHKAIQNLFHLEARLGHGSWAALAYWFGPNTRVQTKAIYKKLKPLQCNNFLWVFQPPLWAQVGHLKCCMYFLIARSPYETNASHQCVGCMGPFGLLISHPSDLPMTVPPSHLAVLAVDLGRVWVWAQIRVASICYQWLVTPETVFKCSQLC